MQAAGSAEWTSATLGEELCLGDAIRAGAFAQAALALANDSVLSLDQLTSMRLAGEAETGRSLIDLLLGDVHFFSHRPRALEISTPIANAGAEGTEFLVRARADRTEVVMFEGRVRLRTPEGELLLASGDGAVAVAGAAPRPEIIARPRDAAAWALYYPPILAPLAEHRAAPGALSQGLEQALDQAAANDPAGAMAALDAVPEAARDARYHTYRAGVLLNVGRVEAADQAIERALAQDPDAAEALAERAVIEVVQNRREQALADARRAVELSPDSAPARIALAYALQASFDLEAARATLRAAAARAPGDALVQARLAELELSFGDLDAARAAAERAVALAPELARTQMVLGFAALTRIDIDAAKAALEHAIALDSAEPLARLGLGLAKIREGDLAAGRRELEIAAALDPSNSLLRSYLGKAYFEERRGPRDADQFQIAKELDPNDPTPYFYDAIRKQSENLPVEALRDLETSIRLNDNRAVYRSRLLLDEDLAARGARLGRIYNDLGFQPLALVEGWKSLDRDPSNHSAHRLLADTYSALPRHEIARDSELLQSQLLQPLNIDPVQPRLADNGLDFLDDTGPADPAFREFTRLFTRNEPVRIQADGIAGTQDTLADNVILSGLYNRVSYSFGQFHFESDGIRRNNDLDQNIFDAFLQFNLNEDTSVQAEGRWLKEKYGDLNLLFNPDSFAPTDRTDGQIGTARLGFRHAFGPDTVWLVNYSYLDLTADQEFPDFDADISQDETGHFIETRVLQTWPGLSGTLGFGYLDGELNERIRVGDDRFPEDKSDIQHTNGYVYLYLDLPWNALLTAGVSGEAVEAPVEDRTQANPKIGLTWPITPALTLRAAAFRVLKRRLLSNQTLEPTQVAGFNQFFDDINGTDAWRYGVGLDYRLTSSIFVGAEYSERDLDVPVGSLVPGGDAVTLASNERLVRAYADWTPFDMLALSAEYQLEHLKQDVDASPFGVEDATTHRFPLEARVFHPSGVFGRLRATYVDQEGHFENFATDEIERGSDRFWVIDAGVGYRLPQRWGLASLEVRNLFDEHFKFQDTDPGDPTLRPERTIFGRLTVTF